MHSNLDSNEKMHPEYVHLTKRGKKYILHQREWVDFFCIVMVYRDLGWEKMCLFFLKSNARMWKKNLNGPTKQAKPHPMHAYKIVVKVVY